MDSTFIAAILGSSVISSFLTWLFTRRKIAADTKKTDAETASEQVDIQSKVSEFLEKLRGDNVDLNKRNVELEKTITEQAHDINILRARLETRDNQLQANTRQLDALRDLAREAPITETLRTQLDSVNQVVMTLKDALDKGQDVLIQKEKTMQELVRTNNDLRLRKPGKTTREET